MGISPKKAGIKISSVSLAFFKSLSVCTEYQVKVKQSDQEALQLVDRIKKQADGLLGMKLISVMDKEFTPASGNTHDYMSLAPYFWYDCTKPNGVPYMRKDGG